MTGLPQDLDESDLEDLFSPWRSAFALAVAAIALAALALYPPASQQAWLYAVAGGLLGYAIGITEHITRVQERRAWRRIRAAYREVTGRAD